MSQLEITGGQYLKSADFDGGKVLTIAKAPAMVKANAGFGDENGMSQELYFVDEAGVEFTYSTNSARFKKAWNKCDPETGDMIVITGSGSGYDRQYTIEKSDLPKDL